MVKFVLQLLQCRTPFLSLVDDSPLPWFHCFYRWLIDSPVIFGNYIRHTVVAIGKFTSAVLWSKTVIFREVYCNVKMPPRHWTPQPFIPHISTFERGTYLCFCSEGSKVTSHQSLIIYISLVKHILHFYCGW